MITEDLIKENIQGLPEDQVKPLVELVNNTFQIELDNKVSEVRGSTFGLVDKALEDAGYPKQSGKTTEHLATVLTTLKENMLDESTKTELKQLKEAKADLEEQLKKGSPDFSKKEKDLTDKIDTLTKSIEEKDKLIDSEKTSNKSKLLKFQLLANMPKTKDGLDDVTKDLHVNSTINDLLKSADFDENDNIVFRDAEGKISYNSANNNNPFTMKEMFEKNEFFKPIMHTATVQTGTGQKPKPGSEPIPLDLSGAKTKVEANEMIERTLLSMGFNKTDEKWTEEYTKLRKGTNIDSLPTR